MLVPAGKRAGSSRKSTLAFGGGGNGLPRFARVSRLYGSARSSGAAVAPVQPMFFDPRTVAGLVAWYDPTDVSSVTLVGGKVSQLNDKSTTALHIAQATGANQPTYQANLVNGKSVIEFFAAGTWLFKHSGVNLNAAAYTVIGAAMLRVASVSSCRAPFGLGIAGGSDAVANGYVPDRRETPSAIVGACTTTALTTNHNIAYDTWYIHSSDRAAATMHGWMNGGDSKTVAVGALSPLTMITVGVNITTGGVIGTAFFDGYWGGSLIYSGVLSNSDRQKIEGYLAWRLGKQASLDPAHPYLTVPPASVPFNDGAPTITPTTGIVLGTVLTCDTGTWTCNPSSYSYQWKRGAANIGTNSPNYTVVAADHNAAITCVVTATNATGASAGATSNSTGTLNLTPANTVAPVIAPTSGILIGDTISVTNNGTYTNSPSSFAYQWKRGATNVGTNSANYTVVAADHGAVITCVVTPSNSSGAGAAATSNPTGTLNLTPANTALPAITMPGNVLVNAVATCSTGSWTNSPSSFAYQWKRGVTNIGTNSSSYTLVAADAGQTLTCVVTPTNAAGAGSPATSPGVTATFDTIGTPTSLYAVNSATTSHTSTNFTPTARAVLFMWVVLRINGGLTLNNPTITDSEGGTWTVLVDTASNDGTNGLRMLLAWKQAVASPVPINVTVACSNATVIGVIVDQVPGGVNISDFTNVVNPMALNAAGDPAPTLPNAPNAASTVLVFFASLGTSSAGAPANYTQLQGLSTQSTRNTTCYDQLNANQGVVWSTANTLAQSTLIECKQL